MLPLAGSPMPNPVTSLPQLQDIELRHQQEAQEELARWDQRYKLRSATLAQLRALAAHYGLAGRSRMRKGELVAALEDALGIATAPAPQQQQQQAQQQQ